MNVIAMIAVAVAASTPNAAGENLDLGDAKRLIRESVAANVALVESLEAELSERIAAVPPIPKQSLRSTDQPPPSAATARLVEYRGQYHVWWSPPFTRTEVTRREPQAAVASPYHADSVFDGTKSVVFFPLRRAATIVQGRSEAPVGRELMYAYHFFSGSLDHLLDHAQRVSFLESGLSDELVIEATSHEGTIRAVVSPSRGCIVEQATAVGPTGEVLGLRRDARVVQVEGGPWFLVRG